MLLAASPLFSAATYTTSECFWLPLPTTLGGGTLKFNGSLPVLLFFASSGQANIQIPWELTGQTQASLTATLNGQTSAGQMVSIAPFAPGIFTMNGQGNGQGAILDSSYRLVDSSNPATPGSTYMEIYCTGLGAVTNQPPSGSAAPTNPVAVTTATPTVTIGDVPAAVLFSGIQYNLVASLRATATFALLRPMRRLQRRYRFRDPSSIRAPSHLVLFLASSSAFFSSARAPARMPTIE